MTGTMSEIKTGSVRANGIQFSYLEMGDGPLLLCLHGFPDHAHSFDGQLRYFAARGCRVVAPFMRGYPPTVTPENATYYTADLAQDVIELTKALGARSATLLGHDWGAHAAYCAAVLAPDLFDRLVTLAVPYGPGLRQAFVSSPEQQRRSWYLFFFQTRFAEAALAHDHSALVERLWCDWSPGWTLPSDDMSRVRAMFASPAVASAALSYYRHALGTAAGGGPQSDLQRRLGTESIRVPCLYLHGDQDGCMDYSVGTGMAAYFDKGLDRRLISGVGHFLHLERPGEINAIIASYLEGR